MPRTTALLIVLALVLCPGCKRTDDQVPFHRLEGLEQEHVNHRDRDRVARSRRSVQSILAFLEAREDLLVHGSTTLLSREQRKTLFHTWESLLDHFLALESIRRYHANYLLVRGKTMRRDSFTVGYAAFLVQYAAALRFLRFVEKNPDLDAVLNEALPHLGLPEKSYDEFKLRFLNVSVATQFAALRVVDHHYHKHDFLGLREGMETDAGFLWQMGKGKGIELTVANAGEIVAKMAQAAFFPIQAGVSEWMGDSRVHRGHHFLISPDQIEEIHDKLEPGDILVERREYYLSNIGLPGFWPHAALYVGTPEERRAFFGQDADIRTWLAQKGDFPDLEAWLRKQATTAYVDHVGTDDSDHAFRVIESMSEGVVHTSLEHSADCDSLAVLRPRLTRLARAQAIAQAFRYVGRPYDFDFDFRTDDTLVCTELVTKSYAPAPGKEGLRMPVVNTMGHKVIPANLIVEHYAETVDTPQQPFDFVLFIDGHKRKEEAVWSDEATFRTSWQRPKWSF